MIKRIIFDLDNTLIPWLDEWDLTVNKTFDYFNIPYEEKDIQLFFKVMKEYETINDRFDMVEMSRYYRKRMNLNIPDNFVEVWTDYLKDAVPEINYELIDLLKYLSSKYSLVVCTNWFRDQQVARLEKYKIAEYFDEFYASDYYDKKPLKEMFKYAIGDLSKDEVVMVGDSYNSDIKGAMNLGMFSYYLTTKDKRRSKKFKVIKSIYELKEYL